MEKFLDFDCGANSARIVNNYDWFREFSFLDFIRDVGKHITINYMLAKIRFKSALRPACRLRSSPTSWSRATTSITCGKRRSPVTNGRLRPMGQHRDRYGADPPQVIGRSFRVDHSADQEIGRNKNSARRKRKCLVGSQADLSVQILPVLVERFRFRRIELHPHFHAPFQEEITAIEEEHAKAPHLRFLQKELSADITARVHSKADLDAAIEASEILFGKGTADALKALSEDDLLAVFEGVPQMRIARTELENGIPVIDLLADKTGIFPSRGETRKMLQGGGVSINKQKWKTSSGSPERMTR